MAGNSNNNNNALHSNTCDPAVGNALPPPPWYGLQISLSWWRRTDIMSEAEKTPGRKRKQEHSLFKDLRQGIAI